MIDSKSKEQLQQELSELEEMSENYYCANFHFAKHFPHSHFTAQNGLLNYKNRIYHKISIIEHQLSQLENL